MTWTSFDNSSLPSASLSGAQRFDGTHACLFDRALAHLFDLSDEAQSLIGSSPWRSILNYADRLQMLTLILKAQGRQFRLVFDHSLTIHKRVKYIYKRINIYN